MQGSVGGKRQPPFGTSAVPNFYPQRLHLSSASIQSSLSQAMSADLFAEFGADAATEQKQLSVPPTRPGIQQASSYAFFDGWSGTPASVPQVHPARTPNISSSSKLSTPVAAVEDNDDWGDFEGGSSFDPPAPANPEPFQVPTSRTAQSQNSWNVSPIANDPFASGFGRSSQQNENTWQRAPVVKAKKSADPSVLFDAEDDLDDDDFGDFEGTEELKTSPTFVVTIGPSSALDDLLGDLGDLSVSQQPKPPVTTGTETADTRRPLKTTHTAKKGSLSGFGTAPKPHNPVPGPAPQYMEDDAGWDTFDDWEASIPTKEPAIEPVRSTSVKKTSTAPTTKAPIPVVSPTIYDPSPGELPPTNVPPPGVLLSLFPSLFMDAQEKLFKPMAAQTLPMRNKLLAESSTIIYLQGYLILANVAAHVIAGRKLRWKRDQHLSQGMKIGPASSRATSGMKLTGIDKGENMKEEREASDVVRVWKEQVGRLRHVVSGANQIKAGTLGTVPDLQEVMPVKVLKQSEGGMPARQPCMLCGLKREERVTAADLATDDSFGEWWIDQVNMHRGTSLRGDLRICIANNSS